jgi:putative redox protein
MAAVSVKLTNQKVQFIGTSRENPTIPCDCIPPIGDGEGYTGLELLLMSLAVCSSTSIVCILRKMRKSVVGFDVQALGTAREQHPKAFEKIFLQFVLHSPDAQEIDLQKAIQLTEEKYCPVWTMLKNNVEVIPSFSIVAGEHPCSN